MILVYIKTAIRNLRRNSAFSVITIGGLAIGLSACLLVANVVLDDLSYDQQWSKKDQIFRLITLNQMGANNTEKFSSSFAGLGPELKKNFPEVSEVTQLNQLEINLEIPHPTSPIGIEATILATDSSIWKLFDFTVVQGNPVVFKAGHRNLVITESFKQKYFPDENPVGKTIRDIPRFSDKVKEFLITGVIKDLPSNTHIRAEALVINKSFTEQLTPAQNGTFVKQYVLLNKSANPELFLQKMNSWYKKFITAENPYQYDLQPIFEVYLNSAFDTSLNTKGSMQAIHIFSGIALLLLVIACFNFINLSSSRLLENLNRTGVRRVLGASKLDIALQVLVEAVCMFMLAAFFAWLFYLLLFPLLEQFIGHPLHLNFSTNFSLLGTAFLILLLLAVLSSAWQAWLISGINPVLFLKGELMKSAVPGKNYLQQSLVVMQFAISIGVVLATIIVQKQVQFLHNKDLGFNKNNLLSIGSVQWDGKGPAFKRELLQVPGVMAASFTTWIPGQGEGYMSRDLEDPANPGNKLKLWYIDGEISLPATLGLTLNEGRMLDEKFALDMPQSDTNAFQHCLITETTLKALQIENLNKPIATVDLQPVGVLQDFNSTSLHSPINPTIITAAAQTDFKYGAMLIRVVPGKEMEVANAIDKIWKNYFQALEPEIDIVSELMAKLYDKESSQLQLFKVFSSLTMLLAAMGVFGLMLQMINRRIKEIGIRKVLGASPEKILVLLSADFFKLVLFASMIALPLVYWMMQHWLNNFAYRIIPGWWMPALATMCGIAIMLLAILMQALRAARANPINSLRTQ